MAGKTPSLHDRLRKPSILEMLLTERCHAATELCHAMTERCHAVTERCRAMTERCHAVTERDQAFCVHPKSLQ